MKPTTRSTAFIGVLLVLFLAAGRSHAQFPGLDPAMNPMGMMRDMQSSPLFLLLRPEVQKELKLDKSQSEQIKKIQKENETLVKEQQKALQRTAPSGGSGGSGDLAQMTQALKAMTAAQAEMNNRAKAVLNDAQKQRFGEIRIQAMGIQAVADPEIQTAISATPEQKTTLTALLNEYQLARLNAYRDIRNALKKQESLEKEYTEKVAKALTAEQTALWKKMEGEPFKDIKKLKMM